MATTPQVQPVRHHRAAAAVVTETGLTAASVHTDCCAVARRRTGVDKRYLTGSRRSRRIIEVGRYLHGLGSR